MEYPKQTDNYNIDILNTNFREIAAESIDLDEKLNDEVERAKSAERVNADAISAETSRAAGAEKNIADDLSVEIDRAQTQESLKAPIASPAFTGTPTAPTPETSANDLRIATTAFVKAVVNALIGGAPETMDTLKEIADAIEANEDVMDALNSAIGTKVDKVSGKGLSTNDYTRADKDKLAGIQDGAEANVQVDWDATDSNSDAFIKNKPEIPTKTSDLTNDSGFLTADSMTVGVLGVKGSAESTYRAGNVNLTPANIGAVATSKVLTTKEQIDANTDTSNVAGAAAVKAIKSDLANSIDQINSNLSGKLDKSSSQEIIVFKKIILSEQFQAIVIDQGTIPQTGFMNFILQMGSEKYSVFFDTDRGAVQPFFCAQNDSYNFYLHLRIDSNTQLSVRVMAMKGYSAVAERAIWLRTYYVS